MKLVSCTEVVVNCLKLNVTEDLWISRLKTYRCLKIDVTEARKESVNEATRYDSIFKDVKKSLFSC